MKEGTCGGSPNGLKMYISVKFIYVSTLRLGVTMAKVPLLVPTYVEFD